MADSFQPTETPRRTWLAAERTWLAWWRTALGGAAVAIAVGRFLPSLTHGSRLPYALLGIGYGLLAIAMLMTGTLRQQRIADALRHGGSVELPQAVILWLTVVALALAIGTVVIIAANL